MLGKRGVVGRKAGVVGRMRTMIRIKGLAVGGWMMEKERSGK